MYEPKGNGIDKSVQRVYFSEIAPPAHLSGVVHRFLEVRTESPLSHDYCFHALPDACTYIIFNQLETEVTGISKLNITSEEFNLGKMFNYVNIRLLPGVWNDLIEKPAYGQLSTAYSGGLPLVEINRKMANLNFSAKLPVLYELIEKLIANQYLTFNPVTKKIFNNIDVINTVADMAKVSGITPRQLQRSLKATTGYTPHDFLKILRLQKSLDGNDVSSYADQSHFIRSFRQATGYTPGKYVKKFDV